MRPRARSSWRSRASDQVATVGRKPKPTALKVLTGNPGKRSLNAAEPQVVAAIPEPPDHLGEIAMDEWRRVACEMHACGILTRLDAAALAAYCNAYARWIEAERAIARMAAKDPVTRGLLIKTTNGNAIQNPLVGTANTAQRDVVKFAAELGITPSARSRVARTDDEKDDDPIAQLLAS